MKNNFDVVWWWRGGSEVGEWLPALGTDLDQVRSEIRRGGRVAHLGSRSVGAPEGAPTAEEFRRLEREQGWPQGSLAKLN
jgi:hypothetical protein